MTTPDGKLARYFYGIDYAPQDLKFGIMESSEGKIGNPVEQLYLYCYHYDPATGSYGLAILRVMRVGGGTDDFRNCRNAFVFLAIQKEKFELKENGLKRKSLSEKSGKIESRQRLPA